MRIYLDSSVVIWCVEGPPALRARIRARFRRSTDAGHHLIASDLTRMECRVGPLRTGDAALTALYEQFFRGAQVALESVSRGAWDSAAEVRATHRLRTPDSLHVACAVTMSCDVLLTGDVLLARCPEIEAELIVP